MYCLYVGFDYTYIDINALAQGIKSFLVSQVWFQAVAGDRTYGTDSPAITSQPRMFVYVFFSAHGAMGRRIDPSWVGPIELFLVPASAPR